MSPAGARPEGDPRARPQTVVEVLRGAESWLAGRGVDAPRRSAELLLGHVLGLDRLHVYLAHDRPLDRSERDRLRALVARRGRHEPIAYLLGSQPFRGVELEVGPGVLVPRPETEELVDVALAALRGGASPAIRILDLGTGSGCLAIALAEELPESRVVAVDVSPDALAFARRNVAARDLGARIELRDGSWWEPVHDGERFDLIVSNPPYVDPDGPDPVDAGVRAHEPAAALFTPPGRPGEAYERIARGLAEHLDVGGRVVVETGGNAAGPAAEALTREAALADVRLVDDLAGRPRFVTARSARGD